MRKTKSGANYPDTLSRMANLAQYIDVKEDIQTWFMAQRRCNRIAILNAKPKTDMKVTSGLGISIVPDRKSLQPLENMNSESMKLVESVENGPRPERTNIITNGLNTSVGDIASQTRYP